MEIRCECNKLLGEDLQGNIGIMPTTDFVKTYGQGSSDLPVFSIEIKCGKCKKFNVLYC
jgi:hypothetical protein